MNKKIKGLFKIFNNYKGEDFERLIIIDECTSHYYYNNYNKWIGEEKIIVEIKSKKGKKIVLSV